MQSLPIMESPPIITLSGARSVSPRGTRSLSPGGISSLRRKGARSVSPRGTRSLRSRSINSLHRRAVSPLGPRGARSLDRRFPRSLCPRGTSPLRWIEFEEKFSQPRGRRYSFCHRSIPSVRDDVRLRPSSRTNESTKSKNERRGVPFYQKSVSEESVRPTSPTVQGNIIINCQPPLSDTKTRSTNSLVAPTEKKGAPLTRQASEETHTEASVVGSSQDLKQQPSDHKTGESIPSPLGNNRNIVWICFHCCICSLPIAIISLSVKLTNLCKSKKIAQNPEAESPKKITDG